MHVVLPNGVMNCCITLFHRISLVLLVFKRGVDKTTSPQPPFGNVTDVTDVKNPLLMFLVLVL